MRAPARSTRRLAAAAALLVAAGVAAAGAGAPSPSRAAWSYDLPDLPLADLGPALDRLAGRGVARLFLSVEDGPRFRLDSGEGRAAVARVVEAAARRGLAVEAMLLQHPRWLDDPAGALRRVAAAAAFGVAPGGRPFDGLHLDVEPHTLDAWECGGDDGRARLLERLAGLAAAARRAARDARGSPVPVSLAVPWWALEARATGGEAASRALAAAADTLVLMAYGEPGGPLVGGDADRLLCRLGLPGRLDALPAGTRLRVGIAGYEYRDAAALDSTANRIDARLAPSPRYAGAALFLDGGPPGARLAVVLRGRVLGPAGRPAAAAAVRAQPHGGGPEAAATANACGRFVLRLTAPGTATLLATTPGGTARLTVTGLVAGREREVGTLVSGGAAAVPPDPARPPEAETLDRARALAPHDRGAARALYASVLERVPGDIEARLGQARLLAFEGAHAEADAAYRALLADRCDAAEAHLGLGDLARWQGRGDAAAEHYRAVAEGWPHEPAGYLGLARVAIARGDLAEARRLLERALALDPSDEEARALLARTAPAE